MDLSMEVPHARFSVIYICNVCSFVFSFLCQEETIYFLDFQGNKDQMTKISVHLSCLLWEDFS